MGRARKVRREIFGTVPILPRNVYVWEPCMVYAHCAHERIGRTSSTSQDEGLRFSMYRVFALLEIDAADTPSFPSEAEEVAMVPETGPSQSHDRPPINGRPRSGFG